MTTTPQIVSWDLLNSVPTDIYERLIVSQPHATDRNLAYFYSESAQRLAGTFQGNPQDDTILLPYLMLYRQAFELQLKVYTKYLARMRKKHSEPNNPDLSDTEIAKKLARREIGHKFEPLLAELLEHYSSLKLSEPFPPEIQDLLLLLSQADKPGTYFRYAGNLPSDTVRVDFHDLSTRFDQLFGLLQASEDWVTAQFDAVPDDFRV